MQFLTYETGDENLGWAFENIIELPVKLLNYPTNLACNSTKL